jgi:dihydroxy-acid dehydratase
MYDLDRASGVPAVMAELLDAGLIHGDALTINGRTVGEDLENARRDTQRKVIQTGQDPLQETGGMAILRGSLAPEGAVAKGVGHDQYASR